MTKRGRKRTLASAELHHAPLVPDSAYRSKCLAHVFGEQLRLLPRCEMGPLVVCPVENEVRIGCSCPAFRRLVDFVPESAHAGGQRHTPRVEEPGLAVAHFPVEPR